MKNKILLLFTLLITFSLNAQIDSLTISNLESKLTKQINQQKTIFNKKLSDIKIFQDSNHNKILNELSILTKNHKTAQKISGREYGASKQEEGAHPLFHNSSTKIFQECPPHHHRTL